MTAETIPALPDNPWREFIDNCISGDNYFRASEYRQLLADLDAGYAAIEALAEARAYAAALAGDGAAWQAVLAVALEMQDSGWVSTDPHEIHAWAGQIVGAIPQHAIDARAAIAKATP